MKTKNILILLFILVFTGVALLGATTARADWNRTCTEVSVPGECIQVPTPETAVYTLKAFVGCTGCDDPTFVTCNNTEDCDFPNTEIPVVLGTNWPIHDSTNNRTIFRYISGVTVVPANVSAQSYIVYNWPVIPSGGDPTGAQVSLDLVWNDCGAQIPPDRIAWKLNRVASKNKDGVTDIYMPRGTGVDTVCGTAYIKWSSECYGDTLWVAAGGFTVSTSETYKDCGGPNKDLIVTFDQCTGLVETVECLGAGSVKVHENILICDSPDAGADCYAESWDGMANCGAQPYYIQRTTGWFCP